jgi:hypothetical protein
VKARINLTLRAIALLLLTASSVYAQQCTTRTTAGSGTVSVGGTILQQNPDRHRADQPRLHRNHHILADHQQSIRTADQRLFRGHRWWRQNRRAGH